MDQFGVQKPPKKKSRELSPTKRCFFVFSAAEYTQKTNWHPGLQNYKKNMKLTSQAKQLKKCTVAGYARSALDIYISATVPRGTQGVFEAMCYC